MSVSDPPKLTEVYHGNCHCGAFRFHVLLPVLSTAPLTSCTCSICHRKGYLWVYLQSKNLAVERDELGLASYQFGDGMVSHKFCPRCGTGVMDTFEESIGRTDMRINVRTLVDVDIWPLKVREVNGRADKNPYQLPDFSGTLPSDPNLKLYQGSCHCGAVTLAVSSKPLPEIQIIEDNCSICQRNAYIILELPPDQVSIIGAENTTSYEFGTKFQEHHFCSTCGVSVYIRVKEEIDDGFETWPEERKQKVRENQGKVPINIRVLNDVEWEQLRIERIDEGKEGYFVA